MHRLRRCQMVFLAQHLTIVVEQRCRDFFLIPHWHEECGIQRQTAGLAGQSCVTDVLHRIGASETRIVAKNYHYPEESGSNPGQTGQLSARYTAQTKYDRKKPVNKPVYRSSLWPKHIFLGLVLDRFQFHHCRVLLSFPMNYCSNYTPESG